MAAVFKRSKDLFKSVDGSTLVFFMRPCNQRQELRPLIESGGGKVTSKVVVGSIKLAEKGSVVSSNDYIEATYIKDCVNQNKLLPMDSYRVQSGSRVRNKSGDSNVSIQSFDSDDSLSPASYIAQTSARDYKGRSKYTKEDDIAMITFLIDERRYSEAHGLRVWKDMEIRKVTSHTASSMNTRYRKHILPNIENYVLDVDRRWLAKLTGRVVVKETEPEFSADALFTTSKKSTKSESVKRKVDLTGKFGDDFDFISSVESSQGVDSVQDSQKCSEKEVNQPEPKEHDPEMSKEFDKKIHLNSKTLKESKVKNQSDVKSKSDTKDEDDNEYLDTGCYSPPNIFEISDERHDIFVKDDAVSGDTEDKKTSVIRMDDGRHTLSQESGDNECCDVDGDPGVKFSKHSRKKNDLRKCKPFKKCLNSNNNASSSTPENTNKNRKDQSSDEGIKKRHTENTSDNQDSNTGVKRHGSDKNCKTQDSDKSFGELDLTKDSKQQHTARNDCDYESDMVQDAEKSDKDKCSDTEGHLICKQQDINKSMTDKCLGKDSKQVDDRSREQVDKSREQVDDRSKEQVDGSKVQVDKSKEQADDGSKVQVDDRSSVKEDKQQGRPNTNINTEKVSRDKDKNNSPASDSYINDNGIFREKDTQLSENTETQPPEVEICSNEVTSSGQFIETFDKGEHLALLADSNIESDSFDEMLKNYIKEKNVTEIKVRADTSNIINEVDDVSLTSHCKGKTNDGTSRKRKRDNDKNMAESSRTREVKKRKLVAECRATIKTISDKYGLSEGFVRQLLFQCSGEVHRLVSYIEYGPHSSELPPWTELDDESLVKEPRAGSLILKFGEKDVMNRYNFINYII